MPSTWFFWFMKDDIETNQFTLSYFDGTTYVPIVDLDLLGP